VCSMIFVLHSVVGAVQVHFSIPSVHHRNRKKRIWIGFQTHLQNDFAITICAGAVLFYLLNTLRWH